MIQHSANHVKVKGPALQNSTALPSKLNTALEVPTTPLTVAPAVADATTRFVLVHDTDVAAIQLVVAQSASASFPVAVAFIGPNSKPASVTLAFAEATLYGDDAVITGAVGVTSVH